MLVLTGFIQRHRFDSGKDTGLREELAFMIYDWVLLVLLWLRGRVGWFSRP